MKNADETGQDQHKTEWPHLNTNIDINTISELYANASMARAPIPKRMTSLAPLA
jgi:hypothetical protein